VCPAARVRGRRWLEGKAGRSGSLGSLAIGVHDGGDLRFMGMVGSGLSGSDIDAFRRLAGGLGRERSPFVNATPPGVRFLDPVLVAEVTFSEVTTAGTLRHPVLEGFRTDIDAADVVVDGELFLSES
jgi:bifunctional non-homologous end joining protein LigD